jgi:NAD(P)H dehydrogenase (quinone)
VLSKTLYKPILFEQVTVPGFLKLLGLDGDKAKQGHFEAVRIDQQEGLLAGTDSAGTEIIGQPMSLEEFIFANKSALSLLKVDTTSTSIAYPETLSRQWRSR